MNKSLLLALVLAVPLAQVARADDRNNRNRKRPAEAVAEARSVAQQRAVRTAPRQSVQRMNPLNPPRRVSTARSANSNVVRRSALQNSRPVYNRPAIRRTTSNPVVNSGRSRNRDRSTNPRVTNNAGATNHRPNANNRDSFAAARHRRERGHHDRDWWRSHYHNTTFVLFGGGYYYRDAGYWFPAYGYDPYYNTYAYDEPIYAYNDLAPGQVLENVQAALRDLGYYNGPIDGLIGPRTRGALGAFQEDNGLVITEAVDEPTLVALGLA
ncbi:MAG: peptidoglycan-binding protein [Chthoniobacterales bacterium]